MRNLLVIGTVLLAAGCSMQPPAPAKVSWQYGAGNGDGVAYPGPAPIYKRAYGLGSGDGVQSTMPVNTQYGYGADNQSGTMVQFAPPPTQTASPAPQPANGQAAPGTHS